jgi:hypothetical protein
MNTLECLSRSSIRFAPAGMRKRVAMIDVVLRGEEKTWSGRSGKNRAEYCEETNGENNHTRQILRSLTESRQPLISLSRKK